MSKRGLLLVWAIVTMCWIGASAFLIIVPTRDLAAVCAAGVKLPDCSRAAFTAASIAADVASCLAAPLIALFLGILGFKLAERRAKSNGSAPLA